MKQNQHIIPQVYLKQFGYQNKGGIWKVPVLDFADIELMNKYDKNIIRQSNIKTLLAEFNVYDIDIKGKGDKMLEDFFQLTEENYPQIIKEIKDKGTLNSSKKDMLIGFISLLYVRAKDFRKILSSMIDKKDSTFINSILDDDTRKTEYIFNSSKKRGLNFLTVFSGSYIYNCLKNFKVCIIQTIPDEKWATTDNPVLIKSKLIGKNIDFMGIDTKVLCPLSPDYLAYIYHRDSTLNGYKDLQKLKEGKINHISRVVFEKIWSDITDKERIHKYLIFPTEKK